MTAMSACSATAIVDAGPGRVPATCSRDEKVAGCVGNSLGYSCSGIDSPDENNAFLNCSVGTAAGGATLYCCVEASVVSSGCTSDSSITSCAGSALGFSCTGSGRPERADSSLVCSQGTAGKGGATLYCCASYVASSGSCTQDTAIQGCGGSGIGFSCSGRDRPDQINQSLTCGQGTASGSATLYCCGSGGLPPVTTTPRCAADGAVPCASPAAGYTCTGGATPPQSDATLTCGQGAAAPNAATSYCCNSTPVVTSTCAPNGAVTGCQGSSAGYSCTGTAAPAQSNSSLLCTQPKAANGATDYCCFTTSAPTTCAADSSVMACPTGADGYSCTGSDTPAAAMSLLCGPGMSESGGKTGFCCTTN